MKPAVQKIIKPFFTLSTAIQAVLFALVSTVVITGVYFIAQSLVINTVSAFGG
ncbi:hypothetical protein JW962_03045 [Candidatus Dojkabacteria bacterium]|nr:hypothetical protein [Candidatus Dojkabacteria bacterium]